ncbi:MAG: leader peptidase (prepilin peptidase) / N-methyltransferase, partial [Solirubrobacteraceae bacterium]|nr:leader peptidase (prepilin peptidase) / N-methyltransferase [Solirubrobacteraceae bacterium]
MALAIVAAAVGGLLIGSFLNVVAWRLPRHESLATPGSRCPSCGTPIKPYDNIPVVSWLLLRGRCRSCGAPISPRYPLVEAATAILYVAVVVGRDGTLDIVLGLLLVTALVPVTLIDLDLRLIPNAITLPAS